MLLARQGSSPNFHTNIKPEWAVDCCCAKRVNYWNYDELVLDAWQSNSVLLRWCHSL